MNPSGGEPTSQQQQQQQQPQQPQHMNSPSQPTPPSQNTPPASAASIQNAQGQMSFRRQRASRACETCHARKVRCDAASLGVPCTNCVAFQIECKIPQPKRKKTQANAAKDSDRYVHTFSILCSR
ncbi:hypothetical protein F5Y02DRAFT_104750 [Annulohypoxylon stygium]|nr:hypothetical protein F5Y02DRAFT_104750 [Annulohypoxylon stygium]